MTDSGDDSFLGRWSRRKHAARRGEMLPEPAPEPPAVGTAAAPPAAPSPTAEMPAAELPPVDSLKGLESEYQDFLRPEVDPATRTAALKKLFGDPHFNQMDGLDVYIDDYTKVDPIPDVMLRALNQARSLGLFAAEEEPERAAGEASPELEGPQIAAIEAPAEPAAPPATAESPSAEEIPGDANGASDGARRQDT
jgi:hypothetical protein